MCSGRETHSLVINAATVDNTLLEVEIRGTPQPQGAIRSLGKGRPSIHANAERLLPWREVVQHACELAMAASTTATWPITGPVAVELTFTVRKPTSAPKTRRIWPTTRPDIDKLARAILDALTNAGVLRDDSQVTTLIAHKAYPNEQRDTLPTPGLLLRLREIS
jgi:Holliday junction resolvase RusA-like endonuclease